MDEAPAADRQHETKDGASTSVPPSASGTVTEPVRRVAALLLVVLICGTIIVFRKQLAGLGALGYPGLYLINVVTSATVIVPIPGLALAFAAGSSLNPFLVGLAVGSGAATGELTGYLAGYGGQGLLPDTPGYVRVQKWMQRFGIWVVFALACIPNPFFDIAGMLSGMMRIPVWRFLLAAWSGNVIKATALALIGAETIARISPLLGHWLMR
jgi:uncharacterized membrane protein YdjX (TVP38/TMEM64 family)